MGGPGGSGKCLLASQESKRTIIFTNLPIIARPAAYSAPAWPAAGPTRRLDRPVAGASLGRPVTATRAAALFSRGP